MILKDDSLPRNCWKLARINEAYPGKDGLIRKVSIAVANNTLDDTGRRTRPTIYLERPVQKLILLVPRDVQEDRGIPAKEP